MMRPGLQPVTWQALGRLWTLLLLIWGSLWLGGCSLPPLDQRSTSVALSAPEARQTRLGRALEPLVQAHPDLSGIHALMNPLDAFTARMLLAEAAERTLDVQYYIWHDDITGVLLFDALRAAADRGVRVRLLLDDNGVWGLDKILAALDSHPSIEVRLFNPFLPRTPKFLGYLTHFERANRRMHNKSFTADNQATIIGGRNIGDEYFGAAETMLFTDLDVLAIGPVVNDVSMDFDRYWASASAYPVADILPKGSREQLLELARRAARLTQQPGAAYYMQRLQDTGFRHSLLTGQLELEWAQTRMVSDDPAKGLGQVPNGGLLIHQLSDILGAPRNNIELVSPYFVPTATGVRDFTALVEQGIEVRILTNSLEATDVAVVHAGYAKRRKDLLRAGVKLYEMKRLGPDQERNERAGLIGSSGSSLHAKTFAVDRERVFVGSFNFDPRSANLNTELGFVIRSPHLARRMAAYFDQRVLDIAYEVQLDEDDNLYWLEHLGDRTMRYEQEPGTGFWQRLGVSLLSHLPIEWML